MSANGIISKLVLISRKQIEESGQEMWHLEGVANQIKSIYGYKSIDCSKIKYKNLIL